MPININFWILALAAIIGFSLETAYAAEMKSLEKIRSEFRATTDYSKAEYAVCRCAALKISVGGLLTKAKQDKVAERYIKDGTAYIEIAILVHEKRFPGTASAKDSSLTFIPKSVELIVDQYAKRMTSNWTKTGDYFSEDLDLMDELKLCREPEDFVKWLLGD
jgi:hypothetical protein